MHLLETLQGKFAQALTDLAPDPQAAASLLKPTQDPRHGDYQANCAMSLAKALGKPPREIAQAIVDRLEKGELLEPPEIAGPGFINLKLRKEWLAAQVQAIAADPRLGVEPVADPRTYVIDFSSPNVAKPMHVGHLRSTILGDALTRMLRFAGHKVITDNHLGDWGTQFGILLYGYKNFLDADAYAADPVRELGRLYVHVRSLVKKVEVNGELEEDPDDPIMAAAREETAKLHAGDPENRKLWEQFMPHSLAELEGIYQRLGVSFDHTLGESFYQPMLADVVADLEAKGIARTSQGALAIFVEEDRPPALIRKRDGAYTYTTTDLATIRYRMEEWKPDFILYVVDSRQADHFKYLFAIARMWGYDGVRLEHVAFGSVLDPKTKKPIKTREGGGTTLDALLNEGIAAAGRVLERIREEARERGEEVPELSEQEKQQIAEAIGIGAVKYADLSQNRTSDYAFNLEKMVAMDGNTATYMQYVYARTRSILRTGGVDEEALRASPPRVILDTEEERSLALQILRFDDAIMAAVADLKPNLITGFLWDLGKTFSTFYHKVRVLKAETDELRQSRLLLCDLTGRVIRKGLELLGIQTLERM